ncbi:MAG: hypothetical protein JJU27_03915, partial [Gammaproteobacteria bacterium]|nr:hypothetical protein [Gammaproteobacteria bacterium]
LSRGLPEKPACQAGSRLTAIVRPMRTHPILREDGSMLAFEIGNTFITLAVISKILYTVRGVSSVRPGGADDRLVFEFEGESCVVNEPFGDNSRYWIGPAFPERSNLDARQLQQAFERHTGTIRRFMNAMFRRKKA